MLQNSDTQLFQKSLYQITMKPRSLKPTCSRESGSRTSTLKLENDYLKTKLGEYTKTNDTQNKYIEGLRAKNAEFVKTNDTNNAIIKNLTTRVTELSRDCLIAKSQCTKLERKLREVYMVSTEVQKTFVDGSNNLLKLCKILEADTEGDLTLGRESSATAGNSTLSTTSKSNMKVLPMMSGHTIQKPTISISKSDSQQINFLIQHQNEIRNDSTEQAVNNSANSSLSNSSKENTLRNITNTSTNDDMNVQNNSNGEAYSNGNEDLSDNMENGDENGEDIENPPTGRLSTIFEITNSTSITNRINVISNIMMPGSDASANNTTNSETSPNSLNRSKKRSSKMPSPIDIAAKMPRGKPNLSKSGHFSYHSSMQRSVSTIGMSTRGSSATFQSDTISEDPLEGPSTLLDSINNSSSTITEPKKSEEGEQDKPMSTSTPMDREKRIRKKSSNIIEPFVDYVTIRKTKSNAKRSNAIALEKSLAEDTSLSKSSSDLSDTTNLMPMNRSRRCRKRQSISLTELSTKTKESNARKLKIAMAIEDNYQEINVTKSLDDLRDCEIIPNLTPKSPVHQRISYRKQFRISLTEEVSPQKKSPDVQNESIPLIEDADNSEDESSRVKIPKKRGRPRKTDVRMAKKSSKRSSINTRRTRRSRSCSPSVEINENPPEFDLRIGNPIVQLVRLSIREQNIVNRRRSRSVSPAATLTGSDRSDGTETSTRSSRRTKIVINYNEPSLRLKMRRK